MRDFVFDASATDREMQTAQLNAMSSLMKLAHLRQRFAPAEPPLPVRVSALEELICTSHPQATIELLLKMFYCYTGRDLRAEVKARLRAEREAGVQRQRLVERPISTFHSGSPTPAEPEAGDEGADDWDPQAVGDIEAGGGESR